jgi:hypothetical protein
MYKHNCCLEIILIFLLKTSQEISSVINHDYHLYRLEGLVYLRWKIKKISFLDPLKTEHYSCILSICFSVVCILK